MTNHRETKKIFPTLWASHHLGSVHLAQIALIRNPTQSFANRMSHIVTTLMMWHKRSRQRLQLQRLDDWQLKDIGLNQCDVYRETSKPFWRP